MSDERSGQDSVPLGDRPITLIGFMGVGKTVVGRRLARKLKYEYVDTDKLVEEASGKTIPRIFADDGEEEFRRLETEALEKALTARDRVISTGGGLPSRPENRELLKKKATIVLLSADPEVILKRVQPLEKRPMLVGFEDPLQRIRDLLAQRSEAYGTYHIEIDTSIGPPEVTAQRIADWFRIVRAGSRIITREADTKKGPGA